jgi:hypothetical protein
MTTDQALTFAIETYQNNPAVLRRKLAEILAEAFESKTGAGIPTSA